MRELSRFIPSEEIDAVAHWRFAAVDTESVLAQAQSRAHDDAIVHARDAARDEEMRQLGYEQGFASGQAQAVLEAERRISRYMEEQGQEAAEHFAALFAAARAQLEQAEQVMAEGVLQLSCEIARQVLRHELSVNPNVVQPVIREALQMLGDDSKAAQVKLNPLDMEVLQDGLQADFEASGLKLIADPVIARGACEIAAAGSVVDASLNARWRRAVASLGLNTPWEEVDDGT